MSKRCERCLGNPSRSGTKTEDICNPLGSNVATRENKGKLKMGGKRRVVGSPVYSSLNQG